MTAYSAAVSRSAVILLLVGFGITSSTTLMASAGPAKPQITILYDAFGKDSAMQKDWGYAALVEYGGKRILFDTGNNPEVLAQNAKAKGVDLSKLDFVVMSHRHGDHMGGLAYLLKVNPKVKIYAPKEGFGVYGADLPSSFYRKDPSLPPEQRYYGGAPPDVMRFGSAWPAADFQLVDKTAEIASDIYLISLVSDKPGTQELHELSLAIKTTDGMVLVVGCSHPGIDKIVEAAATIDARIHLIVGGFHLVVASDADIQEIVTALHDTFHVQYVAPGHCTGEPAFAALKKAFGDRYLFAGLGTTFALSTSPNYALILARRGYVADCRRFSPIDINFRFAPSSAPIGCASLVRIQLPRSNQVIFPEWNSRSFLAKIPHSS